MPYTSFHITTLEMKTAVLKMPAAPEIFVKLGRLLKDRDSEVTDVISLVEKDPSLVAKVCRLSNTAYFNTGEPIGSLEEAINRIGFQELHRIVGVASLAQVFGFWNVAYKISGDVIWHNSLAVALIMEQLATSNGKDRSEAYTMGILRALGKLVIDNCAKTHKTPPVFDLEGDIPLLMWEQDIFGTSNPQTSDFVLESWSFPEEQLVGMRYQYEPDLAPGGNVFARMLNIAGGVAEKMGKEMPGEASYWNLDDSCFSEAGLTSANVKSATGYASEKLKLILKALEE